MSTGSVPPNNADAYPMAGEGWKRDLPWQWLRSKRDCYETTYSRSTSGEQKFRVFVHRSAMSYAPKFVSQKQKDRS